MDDLMINMIYMGGRGGVYAVKMEGCVRKKNGEAKNLV